MKLVQALYEDQSYDVDADEAIDMIKRNCKKFIKESKGKPLYRGTMNAPKELLTKKDIRIRSKSGGYGKWFDAINKAMYNDKMKFTRATALLATGDKRQADQYGDMYQIYIIGDYDFLWSNKIYDYADVEQTLRKLYGNAKGSEYYLKYRTIAADYDFDEMGKMYWGLTKPAYSDKNLSVAIQSGNEIMFSGQSYYAVNTKHKDYKTVWHQTKFI